MGFSYKPPKYHINKHGVPALCKAEDGKCPLGGAMQHFRTKKDAQIFIDNQNKSVHGLLPSSGGKTLEEYIDELKSTNEDRTSKLPSVKINYDPEANVKFPEYRISDVKKKDLSVGAVKEKLLKENRIDIVDLDSTTEEQRANILCHTGYENYKRTGNIVGFLNSDKNSSYQRARSYSKENLVGTFDEIYGYQSILANVGWHKDSAQGSASENNALNELMDRESLETAREILRFSDKNQPDLFYPESGLVGSIQALRAKGWTSQQIKNAAVDHRIDQVVYSEYGIKPRNTSGATEMRTVLLRGYPKLTNVQEVLKDKLGWDL